MQTSNLVTTIFKSMSLFCFWANLKIIYGAQRPKIILFNLRKKSVKRTPKRVNMVLCQKLFENLKIQFFEKITKYRTPFDEKLTK